MREAVQLGAAAVEVVIEAGIVAGSARTPRAPGTNRMMEPRKGAIFMVARVGGGNECVQNWENINT